VTAVSDAREEDGATDWTVETDRGRRDFVTQNRQENALWFSDTPRLLRDGDGNRFEIPDVSAREARSRALIDPILS
jgi:hypothetical protein